MTVFTARASTGLSIVILILLGATGARPVSAQEFRRASETRTNAAYFYYAQPADATVQVELWGVPQPGLYEVPDSTNLRRLLTLAGGAGLGIRPENQKPPRVTVRLYRNGAPEGEPLLEARLQTILQNRLDEVPELRENDVVVVEKVQPTPFTWQDALSIVTTAASLTLLVLRILQFRN